MTVDKSLKLKSGLSRTRSVLSRSERLAELLEAGKWSEEKSVFGLQKVRVRKIKRKPKVKAEGEAAVAGAAPAAEAGKAAPAAKGAPAAKAAPAKAAAPAAKAPAKK